MVEIVGEGSDPAACAAGLFLEQITKLKSHFEILSQEQQDLGSSFDSSLLNCEISFEEVSNAIEMPFSLFQMKQ